MDVYHKILEKYWGYQSFRPLQEDIIHSIAAGRDTLGLMPTGGGKSITFQVPAMAMEGICIVVTPLIALMKDQVDNLRKVGIKATAVYAGMTRQEIIGQLENCIFGDYKFLYVSPERLVTELFKAKLYAMNVSLLVIDESHCISQWGYDFRPSYLAIADVRELLPGVPVLALTATATPEVVNDIQERLHFKEKNVFQKSFGRSNLSYVVRSTEDKMNELVHMLNRVPGTAIVYVRNRKKTKEIATILQQAGISADFFHAGINHAEKELKQQRWKSGECRVIVSTNAFGMGIDKPDVRLVVHIDMPGSLEEYYQEAGRAGRDEQRAYAVALCAGTDSAKLKKRLSDEFPRRHPSWLCSRRCMGRPSAFGAGRIFPRRAGVHGKDTAGDRRYGKLWVSCGRRTGGQCGRIRVPGDPAGMAGFPDTPRAHAHRVHAPCFHVDHREFFARHR